MTARWQGGGFYRRGDEEQMLADVEQNLGPEAAETIRRDLAMGGRPRPLDDRGTGIWILMVGEPADRLTLLAEQIQESECEQLHAAGRTPVWPDCPEHPGVHSLSPVSRAGDAVWVCRASGKARLKIGALDGCG
jgi:hypothetical protein